ncbi:hypothetical protein M3223_12015 [Paenibacillus pasadenensis]|uniref:hypothetical protein n=1 Tax=Paenibacillus pasadenensis TaxID=217090 RepID=UPI00203FDF89|nr:hypothetical protein [Paenibacillus pasadenensis]MCM3748079.1 hypothetical protein [Paenibacillus pasadenensis]
MGWFKKKSPKINKMLRDLECIGLTCRSDLNLERYSHLIKDRFSRNTYIHLLIELGSEIEIERDIFVSPSNDVWYLDTECIEGHGDYANLLRRIKEMIANELIIDDVCDEVDVDAGLAKIAFTVAGKSYEYSLMVNLDWMDRDIFRIFSVLLMEHGSDKRFFYSDIDQSLLVVLIDKQYYRKLNKLLNIFIPALCP